MALIKIMPTAADKILNSPSTPHYYKNKIGHKLKHIILKQLNKSKLKL